MLEAYCDLKTPDIVGSAMYWHKATLVDKRGEVRRVVARPGSADDYLQEFVVEAEQTKSLECLKFYRAFHTAALKRGIPLYLAWADMQGVGVLHVLFDDRFTDLHWQAYEALGLDVAKTQGFKVEHLGYGVWAERKPYRQSESDTAASLGLVISPVTGAWQTLEERLAEAEEQARELLRRLQ